MKIKPKWTEDGLKCHEGCPSLLQDRGLSLCKVTEIMTACDPCKHDCMPGMKLQIKWFAKFVSVHLCSCPADMFDWSHPDGCHNICGDPNSSQLSRCWERYAGEQK